METAKHSEIASVIENAEKYVDEKINAVLGNYLKNCYHRHWEMSNRSLYALTTLYFSADIYKNKRF